MTIDEAPGEGAAATESPTELEQHARALIEACEAELAAKPEPRRAGRLHYETARLYEMPLRDLRRASAHYQDALRHAPEHLPAIRGARRVLLARKSHDQALPLFDAEARVTSDPRKKATLWIAKGRVLEDALGKRDEALEAYTTALELDRSNPMILEALEQTYLAAGSWDALARIWERYANVVAADPRHRAALVVERARITEHRDTDAAVELYEQALQLDPYTHGAMEALKRLHHAHHRWRDLIRVLELEAEQAQDANVRTMALYRIGRLHAERLGNRNEAVAALERAAHESPDEPLVLEELARLYELAGRDDALVGVFQSLAETASGTAERVALHHRMGEMYEEVLDDPEAAARCHEAARALAPTFGPALQALETLYLRTEDWNALVRARLDEAEHATDPRRRAAAHARVAEILETRLDRPNDAAEHYGRALSVFPGHAPSFKALVRLHSEAGRWRELVELHERAIDPDTGPAYAIAHLWKIATIYEEQLGEHAQAAATYKRLLDTGGREIDRGLSGVHALQRASERGERWKEHVEALELEVERTSDRGHKVALLHRAADVLEDKVGDRRAALQRLDRALELDPTHAPSLSSLGRIFRRAGRWDDLLDVYRRELDLMSDDGSRIELLREMAELCEERIGRDDEAIELYQRILEIDPAHAPATRALKRKLHERGNYTRLADVLDKERQAVRDPARRARVAARLGELYEQRLDRVDDAVGVYEQALKSAPEHRPAVDALVRLRAAQQQWGPLTKLLERDAGQTPDPGLAIRAWIREGEIHADRLGDTRRAIGCYERVLEHAPQHLGALLALERLYRHAGRWSALATVYRTQADVCADPGARSTALHELARLQRRRHTDEGNELEHTFDAILAIRPDDVRALEGLQQLALDHDDRARLAEVEAQLAACTDDPALRAAHRTRLGEMREADDTARALEAYREALADDPDGIAATRGMARLAERTDDPTALAEAARHEAHVTRDGEAAARLLVRSADVRTTRLGDFDGALADLERALELAPDHIQAATRLRDMLTRRGEHGRLGDLLTRAATQARDPERARMLWHEVAELQATRLRQPAAAVSALSRALRATPDHVPTLQRLAQLYEETGQWHEAVETLGRVVELAPEHDAVRDAHLRLASIASEQLEDRPRAMKSLEAVVALEPQHHEALAHMATLQQREGRLEEAAETLARVRDASDGPSRRADALVRLGRLEREREEREAALKALLEAVTLAGPSSEAAEEVEHLAADPDEWGRYVEALHDYLRGLDGGSGASDTYLAIARAQHDHAEDGDAAVATLREGLETTSDDALRFELASRLRMEGHYDDAVAELQRLVVHDVTQVAHWRELIRSYEGAGRDYEARLAREPLHVLGAATEREVELIRATPPAAGDARARSLTAEVMDPVAGFGSAQAAAAQLLRVVDPALPKLFPVELEAYGLSTRDRITGRSGHTARQLVDRIATIVGVEDVDLFVHRVRTRGVSVELGHPPAILVPHGLLEQPTAHQVFALARPVVAIALGYHATRKLTPREMEVLMASAARWVYADYGAGLTSEEYLQQQARHLHKALPRRTRKSVEEAVRAYVEAGKVDFARWYAAVDRLTSRVAALIADDLNGSVEVLRESERELSGLQGSALVEGSQHVADLMRFWVSPRAMELRRQTGLLGSGRPRSEGDPDPHD